MSMDIERNAFAGRNWAAHWRLLVIRGLVYIAFGIIALIYPGITLGVLLTIFGIFAFVDGIVAILSGVGSPEGRKHMWALLLVGLLGIAAGIVTFAYPGMTVLALFYIIATWALVTGLVQLALAIIGPGDTDIRWHWALAGAFTVLFAILLYAFPVAGLLTLVWLIGFYAIVFGFVQIVLALRMRGFGHTLREALQH